LQVSDRTRRWRGEVTAEYAKYAEGGIGILNRRGKQREQSLKNARGKRRRDAKEVK
jgi:lipocalin